MSSLSRRSDSCCLCGSPGLVSALRLEPSPIGDAFITAEERSVEQPFLPLTVAVCPTCGHAQLEDVVDPRRLFVDYLFQTGSSPGLVEHFRQFAEVMRSRLHLTSSDRVLEIGSNDGSLLQFFQSQGLRVQGVDPSLPAASAAASKNIPTANTFFTSAVAAQLGREQGPFRLVVANNVFAHSADLAEMAAGIERVLSPEGVFVFEVSYLVDLVEKMLFDTIYHEHVSYHHLQPLVSFFQRHGLEIWDVERIASKGGSLRVYVQRLGGPQARTAAVDDLLALEQKLGVSDPAYLRSFGERLLSHRRELHQTLNRLGIEPGTLYGYGASPTTITLIAHFQLAPFLACLVDDNPQKQGRFAPGWHLPVFPSSSLLERRPPWTLILAWNFSDPIIAKNQAYRAAGGRFVIPLPTIQLV